MPPLTLYAGTFVLVCTLLLTGCGIGTPDIQEFWGTTDDADSQMQLIIKAAKCELRRATQIIVAVNKEREQVQGPLLTFFNTWGADVLFQFTIDEKSALNPVISFTPPLPSVTEHFSNGTTTLTPQSESFGFGGQFSTEGYRQEKLHSFYKISDLVGDIQKLPPAKSTFEQQCSQRNGSGTLLLQSDLKLYDWLRFVANEHIVGTVNLEEKDQFVQSGVITHDVKFDITSAGNFSPTVKLFRISITSGSSSFFSATRDRSQEVIITLGPTSGSNSNMLQERGTNSALASEFKAGFDSVISRLSPTILP
jgi:hypothetical protein